MSTPQSPQKQPLSSVSTRPSRHLTRWYVLVHPSSSRGLTAGLEAELARRERAGEPLFEYFAPTFVDSTQVDGTPQEVRRPLLFNYVFVHSSEAEIYRLKRFAPQYNFLPRVKDENDYHYPYLTDQGMEHLRWVARSYDGTVPLYTADTRCLTEGDRIRLTQGRFKGMEARIVGTPRSNRKEIMVSIEGWMWVPLLKVKPGEYEVIELQNKGGHLYNHLDNDRLQDELHAALLRHHAHASTEADVKLARHTLLQFANLRMTTDVMRCKLYALLLPAYTILKQKPEIESLLASIRLILPGIKAEQARAALLVILYGCTDSSIWYEQAHTLVRHWRHEEKPKKSKARLLRLLADYDTAFGHN